MITIHTSLYYTQDIHDARDLLVESQTKQKRIHKNRQRVVVLNYKNNISKSNLKTTKKKLKYKKEMKQKQQVININEIVIICQ